MSIAAILLAAAGAAGPVVPVVPSIVFSTTSIFDNYNNVTPGAECQVGDLMVVVLISSVANATWTETTNTGFTIIQGDTTKATGPTVAIAYKTLDTLSRPTYTFTATGKVTSHLVVLRNAKWGGITGGKSYASTSSNVLSPSLYVPEKDSYAFLAAACSAQNVAVSSLGSPWSTSILGSDTYSGGPSSRLFQRFTGIGTLGEETFSFGTAGTRSFCGFYVTAASNVGGGGGGGSGGGTNPGATALVGINTVTLLASGYAITAMKPAGVQVGDLMVVLLNGSNSSIWSNPSFTMAFAGSNNAPGLGVVYKVATQADVDSTTGYVFTSSNTNASRNWRATMVVYRNATWQKIGNEQNIRASDIATTGPSLMFYFAAWTGTGATITADPVGMTQLYAVAPDANGAAMAVYTETRAATAAGSGNREVMLQGSIGGGKSIMFALTTQ